MSSNPQYRSRAVRAMVLLHEEHLRRFVHVWRLALEYSVSLPPTNDPAYASLEALGRHVLRAAGGYMIWMCEMLALPNPEIRTAPDPSAIVRDAEDYMEHVLERWRAPLREVPDDKLETPEYPSQWRTRYCIDSMLEHAVMHPIRHAFQLNELLAAHRDAG
uniref:DinB-like domain-containing protein n=1 Tax=Solibacter usitatus (strain Ellin6076) TaxID=234267 RepID=Q021L9_SOLUE